MWLVTISGCFLFTMLNTYVSINKAEQKFFNNFFASTDMGSMVGAGMKKVIVSFFFFLPL